MTEVYVHFWDDRDESNLAATSRGPYVSVQPMSGDLGAGLSGPDGVIAVWSIYRRCWDVTGDTRVIGYRHCSITGGPKNS